MPKPYLSEGDIKDFKERLDCTYELAKEHGVPLVSKGNIIGYNPLDVIMIVSIDRLNKSSKILNRLTKILIILTIVLAVIGIVNIALIL